MGLPNCMSDLGYDAFGVKLACSRAPRPAAFLALLCKLDAHLQCMPSHMKALACLSGQPSAWQLALAKPVGVFD